MTVRRFLGEWCLLPGIRAATDPQDLPCGRPPYADSGEPSFDAPAVPRAEWEWYGSPGHLIVAEDCRFHLATVIGPWLVSTVGEWLPDSSAWHIYADSRNVTLEGRGDARRADFKRKVGYIEIGAGRLYETMVFPIGDERCAAPDCDCGMPVVQEWGELDSDGYNLRGDAQRGHLAMCETWAARVPTSHPEPE